MAHAITAILSGQEQPIRVADALRQAGFTRDEISILLPDDFGAQELGFERKTKAIEGLVLGGIMGALFGVVLGLCMVHFNLQAPGFEAIYMSTPGNAALTMAILCGAITAVLCGVIGLSIPEYIVRKYDRRTRVGGSLLSVHVDNLAERRIAEKILHMEGAQDIKFTDEEKNPHKPMQLAR